MDTGKLLEKPDEMLGGHLRWTSIPSRRSINQSTSVFSGQSDKNTGMDGGREDVGLLICRCSFLRLLML